ncbi:symmetrical bis(5'-nucleosyl)-tetraphosphatase [Achromobacter sp. K91]|nr:symmetrical bis(5'-nucleosyl)-tetraphosphatase [Achromobacter sp. K91]
MPGQEASSPAGHTGSEAGPGLAEITRGVSTADPDNAPAIWAVGDVHGCCASLDALLSHPEIANDPACRLWFVGDLVNRGPQSAATVRRIMALGDRATVVLGNHDVRALSIAAGCTRPNKHDRLDDLINAADADVLFNWLRLRPLMYVEAGYVLTHAGIYPRWSVAQAQALAGEVEALLADDQWRRLMHLFDGRAAGGWHSRLKGARRVKFIVDAFTRMRFCSPSGKLIHASKPASRGRSSDAVPWFDVPRRIPVEASILFGHWAALGLMVRADVACLDTGCVTGGCLTALRLSDRKLLQVACQHADAPA